VEASGFKTFVQSGITLQVNENVRANAVLQVGSITESISISADALHVDTAGSTVGTSVDSHRLTELPLNGRNALNLAQLIPGISSGNAPTALTFARTGGATFNVSGSRSTDNNVMLDGTTTSTAIHQR
jgi:hypothetical protein